MEPTLKQTREKAGKATTFEHTQKASSPPSNERHQTQIYRRGQHAHPVPRQSQVQPGCLGAPLTESGCFKSETKKADQQRDRPAASLASMESRMWLGRLAADIQYKPWFSLEPLNRNYPILWYSRGVDGRMTVDVSGGIRYSLPCRPRGR